MEKNNKNNKNDFYNAEYNPRLRASDHQAVMQGWKQKSALARSQVKCSIDLRYGAGDGETIDVFPAVSGLKAGKDNSSGTPVLVFIHGGYWRGLDKSDFSFLAPPFADKAAAVFMPNYALAPRVSIEHIVEQTAASVEWIYENAGLYGGDPERIFISGHSAGGHLAAMMMIRGRPGRKGTPLSRIIKGGLSISGIYDLSPLIHAGFLKDDLKLDDARAAALSPVNYEPSGTALFQTCVGGDESEEFHRQNKMIREKWHKIFAGDIPMPGCSHFSIMDEAANPQSLLFKGLENMIFI